MTTTTAEPLPLTARQAEALAFIRANAGLYGPSVREIAKHMGINNVTGVVGHLKALEKKGYIRRTPNVARGIEVLRD
jgi:repressor LexA